MLCWLAPSKTYPTEIYRFTLEKKGFVFAQKITSDPHISKESDIHHSQDNEETFEIICQTKHVLPNSKRKQIWKKLCL